MSDDGLDLLREFRAEIGEPDEDAQAQVLRRVLATPPSTARTARRFHLPRRRLTMAAAVGFATVAMAVGLVLAAPWRQGPGALTPAQASVVLKRALAAVMPRPGWVFHEQSEWTLVSAPGAGHYTHVGSEVWKQNGAPYRFRLVNPFPLRPGFEVGGTGNPPRAFVYDTATNTLYRDDRVAGAASPPPGWESTQDVVSTENLAARIRAQIKAGAPVTKTKIDGRSVYRFGTGQNTPVGFDGWTYYVDAKTYAPVRIETQGYPLTQPARGRANGWLQTKKYPATKTVERIGVYEWVPPTAATLARANIETQHAAATVATAAQMPAALKQRAVDPFVFASKIGLPKLNPAGAPAKRLLVDLDRGTLGNFRLGEPLQTFLAAWPKPDTFATSQTTLDPRNPAFASWLARDYRPWAVVSFSDTSAMHANAIYYRGPFQTASGDRNGTPLATFFKHWPQHGQPQPQGAFTRVKVGDSYVWFNADKQLLAVQVGPGNAYTLAGLPS